MLKRKKQWCRGKDIKATKMIKDLQHYVDTYGKNVEISWVMVAPESVCDTDDEDIGINYSGEIGTSLLDDYGHKDRPNPVVEMGFTYHNKEDYPIWWESKQNHKVWASLNTSKHFGIK